MNSVPLIPGPNDQFFAGGFGPVGGQTMQQLIAERLGVPGGVSAPTLVSMVNTLTQPDPPPPVTPVVNPPAPPIPVTPGPLPPVIYDPSPPQQQSPR